MAGQSVALFRALHLAGHLDGNGCLLGVEQLHFLEAHGRVVGLEFRVLADLGHDNGQQDLVVVRAHGRLAQWCLELGNLQRLSKGVDVQLAVLGLHALKHRADHL
ncbi:hypothetical protein SDC9_210761 [bioreactor metagenome]|uniref:Uncharacterized protein n=1 Tax=bioreactor metagenome TaxID=1076179 RepID=A0A645JI30_9ZZZZ